MKVAVAVAVAACALASCASTKALMMDSVMQRAQQDLVCDEASLKLRQVGVISSYKSARQGNVERSTITAEGCGGNETYNVECIRGVCFAVKDVPPRDKDKRPSYYDDERTPQ